MKIDKTLEGTVLTLVLSGELNTLSAPELEAVIVENLAVVNDVILDMSELTYITSAGLRVLLYAQQEVEDRGDVIIRGANAEILEVFEITGFDTIMTIE